MRALGFDTPKASRLIVGETIHTGRVPGRPSHRIGTTATPWKGCGSKRCTTTGVQPENGFGVQVRYLGTDEEDLRMVHDGESTAITAGFHSVVAAPGYRLYYLWIMAGERRELRPYVDPRYRWVSDQA